MRIKYGDIDIEALNPRAMEGHNRDLAALQRETKWKLPEIQEMAQLEGPALALCVYMSFRSVGRLISYAKAEELLDEVEFIVEPGDAPDEGEAEDPTSAPTDSARGEGDVEPTTSRPSRARTGSKSQSAPA